MAGGTGMVSLQPAGEWLNQEVTLHKTPQRHPLPSPFSSSLSTRLLPAHTCISTTRPSALAGKAGFLLLQDGSGPRVYVRVN